MPSDVTVSVGDIVEDRDGTSPRGVVVNRPPIPATDWHVPGRGPLADDNPAYPADDRAIVVLFEDALEEHYPEYTGGRPLPMDQLNADGVKPYAFPESRLRPVDEREPIEVALEAIDAAPFHARNFAVDANRQYIDAIRERGRPKPLPLVRDCGDRYELVNGHKRVWASYVAGLESIPVHVTYLDHVAAADQWARHHLADYGPAEQRVALERLHDRLGERATQIEREYLSTDGTHQACTDGGRDE